MTLYVRTLKLREITFKNVSISWWINFTKHFPSEKLRNLLSTKITWNRFLYPKLISRKIECQKIFSFHTVCCAHVFLSFDVCFGSKMDNFPASVFLKIEFHYACGHRVPTFIRKSGKSNFYLLSSSLELLWVKCYVVNHWNSISLLA